jgi:hypothetical protein
MTTALDDTWRTADRVAHPDDIAADVARRPHAGFGREEIRPCWCRYCDGAVAHPIACDPLASTPRRARRYV